MQFFAVSNRLFQAHNRHEGARGLGSAHEAGMNILRFLQAQKFVASIASRYRILLQTH